MVLLKAAIFVSSSIISLNKRCNQNSLSTRYQIWMLVCAVNKMLTSTEKGDFAHLDVKAIPEDAASNLHYMAIRNRQLSYNHRQGDSAAVRHLSWSPCGASATGGCILSTVSDDERVCLDSVTKAWDLIIKQVIAGRSGDISHTSQIGTHCLILPTTLGVANRPCAILWWANMIGFCESHSKHPQVILIHLSYKVVNIYGFLYIFAHIILL